MAKIFVEDGNRRFQNTGYAQLCRSIMRALILHTDHQILLRKPSEGDYADGIPDQELFDTCPHPTDVGGTDIIFRVGPPNYKIASAPPGKPTILYTQNALGGLPSEWADNVSEAETLIVPGEFDRKVFSRHHDHVYVCPQIVDFRLFKPMPDYRSEGPKVPSFLFVGSFSYRKGADLVFDAFSKAFPAPDTPTSFLAKLTKAFGPASPVNIHLHCFSGLDGANLDLLIAGARQLPDHIGLTVDSRTLTIPWMQRVYNRHDAVFTLSRGEGWCMPLWEGLYSGLPVIAPDSTAMAEWLPRDSGAVEFIATRDVEISKIRDPGAQAIKARYGEPGVTLFEPDIADAARALRTVHDDLDGYKARALANRDALAKAFSVEVMAGHLRPIIDETLSRLSL